MSRLVLPAQWLGKEFTLVRPRVTELLHRSAIISFAILFLIVGTAGILVAGNHYSAEATTTTTSTPTVDPSTRITGLNTAVSTKDLQAKLQGITSQPATLTVGDKTTAISPEKIRSWLVITESSDKSQSYIRIKPSLMAKSLNDSAAKYVKSPVNQVVVTRPDGSSEIVVSGRDGTQLTDPAALTNQANQAAKTVMDAKGLQFTTPMAVLPFQSVTPAAFPKLIEVDVVTKQMYLWENGNLVQSYPISAGAPETPTPIGQYKIFSKYAVQDMRGDNPDGTKYFQPKVKWINYFLPGGYAVHGNYWRPTSWFGVRNSSHGCVSLPDAQAKRVYDWAPIGTTVITHY